MKCTMGFGPHPHHHGWGKWKHQKHCSDQGDDECQTDGHDQEQGSCKRGHGHGPGPKKHGHGHGHGPHKHGHGHGHGPHKHGHGPGPHKHGHGPGPHKNGHDDGHEHGDDHGHHKHGHGHHHVKGHGHHPRGPGYDHGHGHHPHGPGHDHGHGPHKHGHGHHNPLDFLLSHLGPLGGMHRGGRGGHFGHPFGRGGHGGHRRGGLFGHGMRGGHFGHRGHHGRRGRHVDCERPEQTEIDPEILRDQMIDMVDDGMLEFGCYLSSLNQDAQDCQQDHTENCEDCEITEPVVVTVDDATNSQQMYTTTVALGQGVKPSGIKISLKGHVLTVEGKIEVISDDESVNIYEEFTKRVTLPDNVKKNEVKTVLLPDGVLTVQAPLVPRESTQASSGPTEVPIVQMD